MRTSIIFMVLMVLVAVNAQSDTSASSAPAAPAPDFKPVTIEGPNVQAPGVVVHRHYWPGGWDGDEDDFRHHPLHDGVYWDPEFNEDRWAHRETIDAHNHEQHEIVRERKELVREHRLHEAKLRRAHASYEARQRRLAHLEEKRVALAHRLEGLHREVLEAQKVSSRLDALAKNAANTEHATRKAALQVASAEDGIRRRVLDLAKMEAKIKGHAAVIRSIVNKHRRSINNHHPKLMRTLDRLQAIINRLSRHTSFNSKDLAAIKKLAASRPSTPNWHDLKRYITLREAKHTSQVLNRLATQHQLGKLSHHLDRLITVLTSRLSGTPIPTEPAVPKIPRTIRHELLDRRYYALRNEHRPFTRLTLPIPVPIAAHPLSERESLHRLSQVEAELAGLDQTVDRSLRQSEEFAYFRHHPKDLAAANTDLRPVNVPYLDNNYNNNNNNNNNGNNNNSNNGQIPVSTTVSVTSAKSS